MRAKKKLRKNSILGIKKHKSAAVRGARAGCAPPGSASAHARYPSIWNGFITQYAPNV